MTTAPPLLLALQQVDPKSVYAGAAGGLIIIGLILAVVVMYRSFAKHIKRIDFEEEPDPSKPGATSAPGSADPDADPDRTTVAARSDSSADSERTSP